MNIPKMEFSTIIIVKMKISWDLSINKVLFRQTSQCQKIVKFR
jgi:hypothetical protein